MDTPDIGGTGQGLTVLDRAVDRGVAGLCAEALGIIAALNETTLNYLKSRKRFGVPIGKFQALQHRMADMFIAAEQARSMAVNAAVYVDSRDAAERRRAVSGAKAYIGQAVIVSLPAGDRLQVALQRPLDRGTRRPPLSIQSLPRRPIDVFDGDDLQRISKIAFQQRNDILLPLLPVAKRSRLLRNHTILGGRSVVGSAPESAINPGTGLEYRGEISMLRASDKIAVLSIAEIACNSFIPSSDTCELSRTLPSLQRPTIPRSTAAVACKRPNPVKRAAYGYRK